MSSTHTIEKDGQGAESSVDRDRRKALSTEMEASEPGCGTADQPHTAGTVNQLTCSSSSILTTFQPLQDGARAGHSLTTGTTESDPRRNYIPFNILLWWL